MKSLLFFICFFTTILSAAPRVLVVGHGFMGANHVRNLEALQKDGEVEIIAIVDNNPARLKDVKYPSYSSLDAALEKHTPDIIVIASNTCTHFPLIQSILTQDSPPDLFVEKPLVESSQELSALLPMLQGKGYEKNKNLVCGYLFRYSPALNDAIAYLKAHHLEVKDIQVIWQKERPPTRPSAGVHIDEATHPVDLVVHYLLRELGLPIDPITLNVTSTAYNSRIVDEAQQRILYANNPEKIVPLAEVSFEMQIGKIPLKAYSSFIKAPQKREVVLSCSNNTSVRIYFDEQQSDGWVVTQGGQVIQQEVYKNPNKLLLEWKAFLQARKDNKVDPARPKLEEIAADLRLTESLEKTSP
ncbi:MAG: Gfo/Idh/MocA family oxidoreductase [Verrucomicrobia bacterium]|nr:Gfo/Idh/MocA family oxidoreductase [Verrucomicrobiota bacterium]